MTERLFGSLKQHVTCRRFHSNQKCKRLFVNGCECKRPFCTATECLNSFRDGQIHEGLSAAAQSSVQ